MERRSLSRATLPYPLNQTRKVGEQLEDAYGHVYEMTATGTVIRKSPKLKGKDRRLARKIARELEAK